MIIGEDRTEVLDGTAATIGASVCLTLGMERDEPLWVDHSLHQAPRSKPRSLISTCCFKEADRILNPLYCRIQLTQPESDGICMLFSLLNC